MSTKAHHCLAQCLEHNGKCSEPIHDSKLHGRIHSFEAGSNVDGPGIRFVAFLQGCPLKCLYCQNPDLRDTRGGQTISVEELFSEAIKYRSYYEASRGGVTLSGGEPLLQAEFVARFFERCQQQKLHTCLDTSGFGSHRAWELVLPVTNLVLLDIKSWEPTTYEKVTGQTREPTLELAKILSEKRQPFWVRFVLVPGLTDDEKNIQGVAQFCSQLQSLERIEILPFHRLGEYKWKTLGLNYTLWDAAVPNQEQIHKAVSIFKSFNNCRVLSA